MSALRQSYSEYDALEIAREVDEKTFIALIMVGVVLKVLLRTRVTDL